MVGIEFVSIFDAKIFDSKGEFDVAGLWVHNPGV